MEQGRDTHPEEVADICARVAARLIDSVTRTAQLASSATPEMLELTSQWIDLIGREILGKVSDGQEIDVQEMARTIGITPSSLLSILLALHRRGRTNVTHLRCAPGTGQNEDICRCMTED
ncbi:MAG: hypothetical protein ACC613_04925 [Synergistales bacterium]|jgi:hypothetical protein